MRLELNRLTSLSSLSLGLTNNEKIRMRLKLYKAKLYKTVSRFVIDGALTALSSALRQELIGIKTYSTHNRGIAMKGWVYSLFTDPFTQLTGWRDAGGTVRLCAVVAIDRASTCLALANDQSLYETITLCKQRRCTYSIQISKQFLWDDGLPSGFGSNIRSMRL